MNILQPSDPSIEKEFTKEHMSGISCSYRIYNYE